MIYGIIYCIIATIMFFVIFAYYCRKYKEEKPTLKLDVWLDRNEYDFNIILYSTIWPLIAFVWVLNKIAEYYGIKN